LREIKKQAGDTHSHHPLGARLTAEHGAGSASERYPEHGASFLSN